MFKGIVDGVSAVAGQNIAFTTAWNTNLNTRYNSGNNYIEFNNGGYYDVAVTLVVEDTTATSIVAQLYANGTEIPTAIAQSDITATTGVRTLNITDTIKVEPSALNVLANLSVRLDSNATVTGNITVEKRK